MDERDWKESGVLLFLALIYWLGDWPITPSSLVAWAVANPTWFGIKWVCKRMTRRRPAKATT